jgi:hypothetical protein
MRQVALVQQGCELVNVRVTVVFCHSLSRTFSAIPKYPWPLSAHSSRSSCSRNLKGVPMFYYLSSNSSPPLPLHLPGLECVGSRAHDPLRGKRHSTYYPGWICSDGSPSRWGRSVGHKEAGAAVAFYEFNLWMWRYGRGQECKVSVANLVRPWRHWSSRRAPSRGASKGWRNSEVAPGFSCGSSSCGTVSGSVWHNVPAECAWTA